jgi:hypothetical protein
MKKGNVLHYTLIITGIVLAYNALQTLFISILYLGFWFTEGGGRGDSEYFPSLVNYLYLAVQLLAAWWLIMKSGNLSLRIAEKTGANESFKIVTTNKGLLQVVLIAIGVYFIILNITYILNFLVDEYRERNQYQADAKSPFVASLLIKVLTILPAAVLTAYAGEIAAYLTKKGATDTVTIEQDIADITGTDINEQQ